MQRKRGLTSTFVKRVKKRLKLRKMPIVSISHLNEYSILQKIKNSNISVSPNYGDSNQLSMSYHTPDIKLYKLNNVICNINTSGFVSLKNKIVYIEDFPFININQADYRSGFINSHDDDFAYISAWNKKCIYEFDKALFLGGNGSFNFYHWMIELVPKLLFLNDAILQENGIKTLLVNDVVKNNDNYQWLLKNCTNHLSHLEIAYVDQTIAISVQQLYFINTFNQTVYNFKEISRNYIVTTIFNNLSLHLLNQRLINDEKTQKLLKNKKIFILRNENTVSIYNKRSYNEKEVYEYFKSEGFIGIYPDQLNLEDQASIFRNAEFIVGPSGASWSNLVFCQKSTKAISWLPASMRYFDTYSTLAYLKGVDMQFIEYQSFDNSIHGSYTLNLADLNTIYRSMNDS